MRNFSDVKRIVIKVGTSTLTFENGELNLRRIQELALVVADVRNSGKDVILVSSGAVGAGVGRLGLKSRPTAIKEKQAAAAVGQSQLVCIYDEFFRKYNKTVGQVLLTRDVVVNEAMHENVVNTFETLLDFGVIPIVNENDSVSIAEIIVDDNETFSDNDTLSAHVANIVNADLLIMLSDIDGLYDRNPAEPDAKLISEVTEITEEIKKMAGGAGSTLGTGGMVTKILAVEIAKNSGTKTLLINGNNPAQIYNVLEGEEIGTYFNC